MNIAVIGLGLIGGSIAKAIKHSTPHTVLGFDKEKSVTYKAKLLEAIDKELDDSLLALCDMVIVATYPQACIEYVKGHVKSIKKGCIVMDTCGIKSEVCKELMPFAAEHEFVFVGAHPMAGIEFSGFDNAQHTLFQNASIILTPMKNTNIETLHNIKKFWGTLGFTNFEITTPQEHDRRIAYTSQLAHVVSSAYIKSPTALEHFGFSAGSYKDMTRVARLNEIMWSELFLDNREFLEEEIDTLICNLEKYKLALENNDRAVLIQLLKDGRERKERADREDIGI